MRVYASTPTHMPCNGGDGGGEGHVCSEQNHGLMQEHRVHLRIYGRLIHISVEGIPTAVTAQHHRGEREHDVKKPTKGIEKAVHRK